VVFLGFFLLDLVFLGKINLRPRLLFSIKFKSRNPTAIQQNKTIVLAVQRATLRYSIIRRSRFGKTLVPFCFTVLVYHFTRSTPMFLHLRQTANNIFQIHSS
jgi:hypothetical protein